MGRSGFKLNPGHTRSIGKKIMALVIDDFVAYWIIVA
jgi:hypothetical protein